jgi:hypothetical protein
MSIRKDIKDFPFSCRTKITWFFLIEWDTKKIFDYYNVSGKSELISKLKEILDKKEINNYKLFGVWKGEYSADIFQIPIEEAFKKLSNYFSVESD